MINYALKHIRAMCTFMKGAAADDNISFMEFIISCKNCLTSANFEMLCVFIWRSWFHRNYFRKVTFVGDFVAVVSRVADISWCTPDEGRFKVNTDATVDLVNGKVGIGVIIKDNLGDVLASSSQPVMALLYAAIAEALATYRGLVFAFDSGLLPCTIEMDAQVVVRIIDSGSVPLSDIGTIISDVVHFLDYHIFRL
ncbi:hypothetical protein Q3G72_022938 [Acer saccharum]|nr:hypothetical protein Q3G72_022938 [Acer saccharum]